MSRRVGGAETAVGLEGRVEDAIRWQNAVARGPIINLARRLHFRVAPLLAVALAMS